VGPPTARPIHEAQSVTQASDEGTRDQRHTKGDPKDQNVLEQLFHRHKVTAPTITFAD